MHSAWSLTDKQVSISLRVITVKLPALYCSVYLLKVPYYHLNVTEEIVIKCLNQIIIENKPYNLRLRTFKFHKFQEKKLNLNRESNSDLQMSSLALCQDSSMAERQTRDLEVRVRIPVQVQIFLLKFM